MSTRRWPFVGLASLAVLLAVLLAACSGLSSGASPGSSATPAPGGSSTPASVTPGASPSTSPSVSASVGHVDSAAQAAALVFASEPMFNSIKPATGGVVGQSTSYDAYDNGNGFSVSITMGSGDCPSGCINKHTWNYTVTPAGSIKLVSEQGDPAEVSIDRGTADPATVTIRLVAGPVCPVERNPPDPSCAPRAVPDAQVVLRDPSGAQVASGNASADGTVTFNAPGGAYFAEAAAVAGLMGQASPVAFSVPGGRSVTITMEYDTGIR